MSVPDCFGTSPVTSLLLVVTAIIISKQDILYLTIENLEHQHIDFYHHFAALYQQTHLKNAEEPATLPRA